MRSLEVSTLVHKEQNWAGYKWKEIVVPECVKSVYAEQKRGTHGDVTRRRFGPGLEKECRSTGPWNSQNVIVLITTTNG